MKETTMAIIRRLSRLCRADLHGVLDQLEDKELMLKQALRDMEGELARKEERIRRLSASREQLRKDMDTHRKEREKFEQDLSVAVEKNRDDIARFLIRKIKPIERHMEFLQGQEESLDQDIAELGRTAEEQRRQVQQMQVRVREYCRSTEKQRRERILSSVVPCPSSWEPSDEEVELELLRYKEKVQEGGRP
jgi:phage shock protein A